MEEEKKVVGEVNGTETKEQQQPAQAEQQAVTTEPKDTFGKKLKRHWKGLTAGALGILTIGATAVAAYKRGKSVGTVVPNEPEDYSLNPNE